MRFEAGQGAGTVRPVIEQVRQASDGLGRPGGSGQVLAGAGGLDAGRCSAVRSLELGQPFLLGAVDPFRAGGEVREEVVADAGHLERRVAARPALAHRPLHGKAPGELVSQERVVDLGDGDDRSVHGAPVEAAPGAVVPLDLVGDDDVGVQVRVTGPGVPMVERSRDHPAGVDLLATSVADAGADDALLDELQR